MSLVFNGVNQYAIHDITDVPNATTPFTIAITFKTGSVVGSVGTPTATPQYPVHINRASSFLRGYGLEISTTGNLTVFGGTGSIGRSPTILTVSADTIYRCVMVYDGAGVIRAYVNNISTTQIRSGNSVSDVKTRIITGALFDNAFSGYFNGKVIRLGFWSQALGTPDITLLLDSANDPADVSVPPDQYWPLFDSDTIQIGTGTTTRTGAIYDSDELLPPPPVNISSLTSPLVIGGSYTVTTTGFANGAATLSFGGVSSAHTLASGSATASLPPLSDNLLCPFLPATGVTVTETQGALTATISRNISVQSGWDVLRDGSNNPANFAGIVLGNSRYIGQAFADAGNPLTTSDRAYYPTAYGLIISPDGRVQLNSTDHATNPVPSLPYTTSFFVHRASDGRMYEHSIVIGESGAVVVTPSIAPRTRSLLRVSGSTLTIDGVAHTNGQPISLSPYGGVQSGINGAWLAQSVSASAGNLVVDGVAIVPPKALYLSPAGKLTATPNGQAVATVRP